MAESHIQSLARDNNLHIILGSLVVEWNPWRHSYGYLPDTFPTQNVLKQCVLHCHRSVCILWTYWTRVMLCVNHDISNSYFLKSFFLDLRPTFHCRVTQYWWNASCMLVVIFIQVLLDLWNSVSKSHRIWNCIYQTKFPRIHLDSSSTTHTILYSSSPHLSW
jgi:hypothetical protein